MAKKTGGMRDRVRERAEERKDHGKRGGKSCLALPEGVEEWKPLEDTTYKLDILPYVVSDSKHPDEVPVGEEWYHRIYKRHRDVGPEKKTVICPKSWGENERCPICERAAAMRGDEATWENEALKGIMKKLEPQERELFNVVDLGEDEPTVKIWDMSTFLFGDMLEREIREGDEELADFAELDCGRTLKIRFEERLFGKGKKATPFYAADRIDFLKREPYDLREDADILDEVVDLDALLVRMTFADIEALFEGDPDADTPDKDEPAEEAPRKPRGRRSAPPDEDADDKPAKKAKEPEASPEASDDDKDADIGEGEPCEGCDGSGKNSRGRDCRVCGGTGFQPADDEPAETPPAKAPKEEEPPARSEGRRGGRRRG